MKKSAALITTTATLALTACGGVEADAHYEDANALRDALNSQGYECTGYQETWEATWGQGATSIECEEDLTIGAFPEDYESPDGHRPSDIWPQTAEFYPGSILWSDSWVIMSENRGMLQHIQEDFGGQLTDR